MIITIYTDGAARGNPGEAGAGAVIKLSFLKKSLAYKKYLGRATNNQAEYKALILGLEEVKKLIDVRALDIEKIICYSDSQLLVRQLQGSYKVKDKELGKLFVQVWNLLKDLPVVEFVHIPREKNKKADVLANQAIDQAS